MEQEIIIINKIKHSLELKYLDDYYIITFKDLFENYKMYIVYKNQNWDLIVENKDDSKTIVAFLDKSNYEWKSQYGEIDSVVSFKYLIVTYNAIKNIYSSDDINEIVEKFKDDYLLLMQKDTVKRLDLHYNPKEEILK